MGKGRVQDKRNLKQQTFDDHIEEGVYNLSSFGSFRSRPVKNRDRK